MSESPLTGAARELEQTVAKAVEVLTNISDEDASKRPAQGKWTKKEILGHLIDSAANNHQKFVRAMTGAGSFTGYDQEAWVSMQRYNYVNWNELIDLWRIYNRHLARIIENAGAEDLTGEIEISGEAYTLEFLMKDYVVHLKHHLNQIVHDAEI